MNIKRIKQDKELLREARAVNAFKTHLSVYLITIVLLWLIWFLGGGTAFIAWPVYPSAVWGIILVFHLLSVYRLFRDKNKTGAG
jgi:putative effector of murein hydrolase LrgA (UPF0299 family)